MPAASPSPQRPISASSSLPVHAVLIFVQICFGLMHVVAKDVLQFLGPLQLATLRVLAASPLLLLLAWWHDRILPPRRELPLLVLLGVLGVSLNQLLFIFGLSRTTASNAAILMPSIPVFAVAVAAVLGIERIGPRRLLGVLLTVAGCLVLVGPGRFTTAPGAAFGNLLILLNCLSYATFLVIQRPILQRLPWRTVIAWSFFFGTVGIVLAGASSASSLVVSQIPARALTGMAFIVIFPTVLGYALSTWAVRRSSPSMVAIYTTVQPMAAAVAAILFLGESVGPTEIAGFVLISAGVFVASLAYRPRTA